MNPRKRIINTIIDEKEPSWKSSVFAKIVFKTSTRGTAYFGITELIAFCDAFSILFVSYLDKWTHYFDLNRKFDA